MTENQKKFGLYFVSMASAYGLGNIWRFPYLIYDYGMGAFLVLFCFLCFFIGVPLIVTEVLLGKSFSDRNHESSSHILRSIFYKTRFPVLWWLPSVIALLVLAYYTLISCWILHYVARLFYAYISRSGFATNTVFIDLMNRPILLILLSSVHVLIMYLFLNKGEKLKYRFWINAVIPILTFVMGYIAYRYFSLDDIFETSKALLYPNFSMLKKESLNYAIGHMLFTLSLGFGTLIGVGLNLSKETSSTTVAARIGLTDSVISILLLAVIFPMVLNTEFQGYGSEILFYVIPGYFAESGLSLLTAFIFYLLIYLCSLTAGLSLAESLSSNIYESSNLSKNRTQMVTCFLIFIISVLLILFSKFSKELYSVFFEQTNHYLTISQVVIIVDDLLINFILPVSVIIGLRAAIAHLEKDYIKDEFSINEGVKTWPYFIYWKFIIKIGFPILFLFSLILRFL